MRISHIILWFVVSRMKMIIANWYIYCVQNPIALISMFQPMTACCGDFFVMRITFTTYFVRACFFLLLLETFGTLDCAHEYEYTFSVCSLKTTRRAGAFVHIIFIIICIWMTEMHTCDIRRVLANRTTSYRQRPTTTTHQGNNSHTQNK